MSKEEQPTTGLQATKNLLQSEIVKSKLQEMLGQNSSSFVASALQAVASNKNFDKVNPSSILNACINAASMNLPISNSLGFAWVVPYKGEAQFQIGWKGLVQLAHRTGMYRMINVFPTYENQNPKFNVLEEQMSGDFNVEGIGDPVGYVCVIKMTNGFSKVVYWTKGKIVKHAKRYSQNFGSDKSAWTTNFDEMALKTVLKNTLSKYGYLSLEMQRAIQSDQSVVLDNENGIYKYVDNDGSVIKPSKEEVRLVEQMTKDKDIDLIDFQEKYQQAVNDIGTEYVINEYRAITTFEDADYE